MPHAPTDGAGLGSGMSSFRAPVDLLLGGGDADQKRQKTDKRWSELRPQSRNRSSNKYIYIYSHVFSLFFGNSLFHRVSAIVAVLTFSHKIFHFILYLIAVSLFVLCCFGCLYVKQFFTQPSIRRSRGAWLFCFRSTPCVWSLNLPDGPMAQQRLNPKEPPNRWIKWNSIKPPPLDKTPRVKTNVFYGFFFRFLGAQFVQQGKGCTWRKDLWE